MGSEKKRSLFLFFSPFIALLGLAFLFYAPSLHYGFIFDDLPQITKNFHLKILNPSHLLFSDTRWLVKIINYYTYRVWGINPFGYRLTNVLLHLLLGTLVFFLILLVARKSHKKSFHENAYPLALTTAGLFLLHPAQTQTVTYITQMRHEGLVALFSFGTLLLFAVGATTSHTRYRWLCYTLAFLGAPFASGSKEIIVILPVLLVLFDWHFLAQGNYKLLVKRLPIYGIFTFLLLGTFSLYNQPLNYKEVITFKSQSANNHGNTLTAGPHEKITPYPFILSQFKVVTHYLRIFIWPFNLSFDYDYVLSYNIYQANVILPLILLLLLCALGIGAFFYDRTHLYIFCLCWFMCSIIPRASIIPSPEMVCDYKTYLSSFGVFLGIGQVLVLFFKKVLSFFPQFPALQRSCAFPTSLFFFGMGCLGYATYQRNHVWSSPLRFWEDIIAKAPKKARAYNNYAGALAEQGNIEKAIPQYKKALACEPSYSEPHLNLAYIYQGYRKYDLALKHYQEGLRLATAAHPEMYNNIGRYNSEMGDYERAIRCFTLATTIKPHYSSAHANLGKIFLIKGHYEKACTCFKDALKGDAPTLDIHYLYGETLYRLKQWHQALNVLDNVQAQATNYKNTSFIQASCYYQLGDYKKAAHYFEKSYAQSPENLDYLYNYAQALLNLKEYSKAHALFEKCASRADRYAFAPLHNAKCLAYMGQSSEACKQLQNYLKTRPVQNIQHEAETLLKEIKKGYLQ